MHYFFSVIVSAIVRLLSTLFRNDIDGFYPIFSNERDSLICFEKMPLWGKKLSECEILQIEIWIEGGTPE